MKNRQNLYKYRYISGLLALVLIITLSSCIAEGATSYAVSTSSEEMSKPDDSTQEGSKEESSTRTVFEISTEAELEKALLEIPRDGTGKLIFLDDITLTEKLLLDFPLSLSFKGALYGEGIVIEASADKPIAISCDEIIADGLITVLAPYAALSWEGEYFPLAIYVALYMNVFSYNGLEMSEFGYGGAGQAELTGFEACGLSWLVEGNTIYAEYDYGFNESELKTAAFSAEADGEYRLVDINGEETAELASGSRLIVTDPDGGERAYAIIASRKTLDLPIISIYIENGETVKERDVYLNAVIEINGNGLYSSLSERDITIKGRGHSTWKWDKKPYRLKFASKTSVFGLAEAKNWVLLANYADKSLIRNTVAFDMAKLLGFEYTPTQIPVDLFINGEYQGVYSIGEKLEAASGRVELPLGDTPEETGYMFEIGGADVEEDKLNTDYFHAGLIKFARIITPDDEIRTQAMSDYLIDFCRKADEAVAALEGYDEYIDIDSLIDWFIITEISYNLDCSFRRSCYMTLSPGGKLTMGPLWDFDLAFGNFSRDNFKYDDWASVGEDDGYVIVTWMNLLMTDKSFVARVKSRWNEVKDDLYNAATQSIDYNSALIYASQEENFIVWDIMNKRAGYQPSFMTKHNTYEKQLDYLRDFIKKRMEWIDKQLNK